MYDHTRLIMLVLCITFIQSQAVSADSKVKLIPLVPLTKKAQIKEFVPRYNPNEYNKRGRVDAVDGKQIVINDVIRYLNSNTQIFSESNMPVSKYVLVPGQMVEYKINQKNNVLKIKILKTGKKG